MPARTVVGWTHAVALVPAAQRRGGYAEALSDDADRVQGFVRVASSRPSQRWSTPTGYDLALGIPPFNAGSMQTFPQTSVSLHISGIRPSVTESQMRTSPGGQRVSTMRRSKPSARVSEALEWVERARGHLYSFHQLMGHGDLLLGEACDKLRQAGHEAVADRLESRGRRPQRPQRALDVPDRRGVRRQLLVGVSLPRTARA